MKWRRIVMLGTGTGVGKTTVTVALAQALAELGADVAALKPVETGYEPLGSDARRLQAVSRGVVLPEPHPLYAFDDPISPHLAARRQATTIQIAHVANWVGSLADGHGFVLVETAGGALSPLSEQTTNLDLARALEPARLVLVAPDSLGVLHDVRATVTAMRALHRAPDHLVLSRARPGDASTGTNAEELWRLGLPLPAAVVADDPRPQVAKLAALIAKAG
jgi:dethiobiotin synthetase